MIRQDSIKKILKIAISASTYMSVKGRPMRLEVRRGGKVVKSMTTPEWDADENLDNDQSLPLIVVSLFEFLLIITNEELNTYEQGEYTVNLFYSYDDSDFIDGTRMRFVEMETPIIIGHSYTAASTYIKKPVITDDDEYIKLVEKSTNSAGLSSIPASTLVGDTLTLSDDLTLSDYLKL